MLQGHGMWCAILEAHNGLQTAGIGIGALVQRRQRLGRLQLLNGLVLHTLTADNGRGSWQ